MIKKTCKLFIMLLAIVLFTPYLAVSAKDNSSSIELSEVSLNDAALVALAHISSMTASDESISWNKGVKINSTTALFDLDDTISAYLFKLVNLNEEPSGYIIVSAKKSEIPIIEFGYTDECFIDNSISYTKDVIEGTKKVRVQNRNSKVYYLSDLTYFVQHKLTDNSTISYDISSGQAKQISKEQLKTTKMKERSNNKHNHSTEWEYFENIISNSQSKTRIAAKDQIITSPGKLESGYKSQKSYTLKNGNITYYRMEQFSDGGVCAPTAATNYMLYWYKRDTSKYKSLLNGSWQKTFNRLFTLMKTDKKTGTYDNKTPLAYETYLKEKGFKKSIAGLFNGTNNGKQVAYQIDLDRPCHLIVHSHPTYKDHAVLAIGYQRFNYSNTTHYYIRIADGWINSASRYVSGTCTGNWSYVAVKVQ